MFDTGRTDIEITDKNNNQNETKVDLNMSKEILLTYGYTELCLYIEITLAEEHEGFQNINIKGANKQTLATYKLCYTPGECTKTEGTIYAYHVINLSYVDDTCGFWISYFGSGGNGDDWWLKQTIITAIPQ